jgi:hypothetical protein
MGAVLGFEYAPEYAELVRRIFHGDAPGGVVPAGIILANDRAEWAILRSELNWQLDGVSNALAANFSGIAIRMTPPNRLSIVEEVWIINDQAAAQAYRIGLSFGVPNPNFTVKAAPRDGRRGTTFQPSTTLIGYQDVTGFLLTFSGLVVPPNSTLILAPKRSWVVQPILSNQVPFTNLIVQNNVVNQNCKVIAFGYERPLRTEEKTDS